MTNSEYERFVYFDHYCKYWVERKIEKRDENKKDYEIADEWLKMDFRLFKDNNKKQEDKVIIDSIFEIF
jgi:hypothetical protein